jgi:LacI family transcriptional regulator
MTTLKDISRHSGFSVTTVSRALNGFSDVTPATRARIEAVARAMNYRPNQVARKLVSGRSGMVGLVLAAPPAPFEQGHFFHVIAGCSREFSARDIDFVLHIGTGTPGIGGGCDDELTTYARLVNRGTLDGFIVTAPRTGDPRIALLLERGVPFVVHGRDPARGGYAFVDADNAAISRAAVDHLAGLGHRRIALLNGPEPWGYAAERLRGFRAALDAHALPFDPSLVCHGDTSAAYGRSAAAALVARDPRPTALVCCNSLTAAGALEAARDAGLSLPADLSLVAHDDVLPQAETDRFEPTLTVTRLPLHDAAGALADLLLARIAGAPPETLQTLQTAPLIPRASTARPPGRPVT